LGIFPARNRSSPPAPRSARHGVKSARGRRAVKPVLCLKKEPPH